MLAVKFHLYGWIRRGNTSNPLHQNNIIIKINTNIPTALQDITENKINF
jgi:hypothetical protein